MSFFCFTSFDKSRSNHRYISCYPFYSDGVHGYNMASSPGLFHRLGSGIFTCYVCLGIDTLSISEDSVHP